jgi:hypothetical protein
VVFLKGHKRLLHILQQYSTLLAMVAQCLNIFILRCYSRSSPYQSHTNAHPKASFFLPKPTGIEGLFYAIPAQTAAVFCTMPGNCQYCTSNVAITGVKSIKDEKV